MASQTHFEIPSIPAPLSSFLPYLNAHSDTLMEKLILPYKQRDAKLREIFAQDPDNPALTDHYINTVPVFDGHESTIKIRARDVANETEEQKKKYVMPLKQSDRREHDSPAIVGSLKEFRENFNVFSESSLVDMDWSNVVVAGSAVVSAMLPIPPLYGTSKRSLRQYYHQILAPASDVDLFLYGLTEEEAITKIKQIETKIRDSILQETTTIRTKHAITIASQYPTRHVQIVLRLYKSVSEILTGFDVDCSCAAYDGNQVYASPRALAAYMTQINTIDLSRRSPSYENRLSKYSHRGFEVYWPQLDRSRIDPTIFERNFGRTVGLARLLVLEKLPKSTDRDVYTNQRRLERGRPPVYNLYGGFRQLAGNIKDGHEDDIAEWVEQDETVPYGEKFHAKRIEKLLYTKDLLLNAEWNKPKDRKVHLHRHPAFFGYVDDVIGDCCGYCPKPLTSEDEEVAEHEAKIYLSGAISFIKDDPGRQTIGSFNPVTNDDWTEMAYVGNTARLCQAIVDGDLEHVQDWLSGDDADPNCRDYTGRTPLQLAVLSSTPEIVQCLVDHGARLVARMADGRTALHLAAAMGRLDVVRILLIRSEANETEEAEKQDVRRKASESKKASSGQSLTTGDGGAFATTEEQTDSDELDEESNDSGERMENEDEDEDEDLDTESLAAGSYVKVNPRDKKVEDYESSLPQDAEDNDPDFYDINVLAWDTAASALHLAIVNGHVDVVKELVQTFGADALLPIKLLDSYRRTPRGAILTLVLALTLPLDKAKDMATTLIKLGASSAQADTDQKTALLFYAGHSFEMLQVLIQGDDPAVKRVINHISVSGSRWRSVTMNPLTIAIDSHNPEVVLKLLEAGANPAIGFSDWVKSFKAASEEVRKSFSTEDSQKNFLRTIQQPILAALDSEEPSIILELLNRGADPNTLTATAHDCIQNEYRRRYAAGESILDVVRRKLKDLRAYEGEMITTNNYGRQQILLKPEPLKPDQHYLETFEDGTYSHWLAKANLKLARLKYQEDLKTYNERVEQNENRKGVAEKKEAIKNLTDQLEVVEKELLNRGAKTFAELHPTIAEQSRTEPAQLPYKQPDPDPFEVAFGFHVSNLTPIMKDAYLDLFEAVWRGDLDTVKAYTLAPWGPSVDQTPLQVAAWDHSYSNPFTLAVLRGHLDVAKAILEIAQAQYAPEESNTSRRWNMAPMGGDEYDTDDDASTDSQIRVYAEIVDDRFTIDNIGEVATQVKSSVQPQTLFTCGIHDTISKFLDDESNQSALLSSSRYSRTLDAACEDGSVSGASSLLDLFIMLDDADLLTWALNLSAKHATACSSRSSTSDPSATLALVPDSTLQYAITLGRTSLLSIILSQTGAGIPLNTLVKKSGVQMEQKLKYYQGLSVHGRKREDWAAAGRGTHMSANEGSKVPPLLQAAYNGSIESLEWFLSGAPMRCYAEFAAKNAGDERVRHLEMAAGGFEGAIGSFLGARSNLALHSAVMSKPGPNTVRLVKFILCAIPSSLHTKSMSGFTPLQLAFALRRPRLAKLLIEAGADQTTRDCDGNNILHSLLNGLCGLNSLCDQDTLRKLADTRRLLQLVDSRLLGSLFLERCSEHPGAMTPLHRWLYKTMENDVQLEVLKMILEFSHGAELELINGAGDTPLHTVVAKKCTQFAKEIVRWNPALVYRENATGRTPVESALDSDVARKLNDVPLRWASNLSRGSRIPLVSQATECFVKDEEQKKGWDDVWREVLGHADGKRRLVSLFEANEVARRLAEKENQLVFRRRVATRAGRLGHEEQDKIEEMDEVSQWFSAGDAYEEPEMDGDE